MYPPGCAKVKCSWHHCLPGLLLQLLLALCFFSYLRMSQEKHKPKPMWVSELGAPSQATEGSSAHLPLRVLLWTWPFNQPVALSRCSELWPGTADCQLTVNRSEYPQVDAVLVHHREFSHRPQMQLPPSPRPPGQRWVWFSMESPSNCLKLKDLDGYFNLTMSYRRDSDIFMPYGWLEPWPSQPVETLLNISAKTKLVAWVVSNWNTDSIRVQYYKLLKPHLQVDVYGRFHTPLPHALMAKQLSQYKFYLAFENSLHPDYITEKLWKNALQAWAVPVVLGPSRVNYEQFLPPKAFIHVEDFQSPKDLAQYLLALDKDYASYLNYFRWRETLRPRSFSWALMFCKACWKLQQEPRYLTTKEQFHEFLEAKGQEKPSQESEAVDPAGNDLAEPEAKRIRLEDGQTEDGQAEEAAEPGEQLQAQKRARGQNKCRPHVKPTHYDKNKLCPSLVQESAARCFYGDRCRFLHDVGHYLETKPADLGPSCVLFETFGRCPYGVTCRFAGAHLGPEGQNLVREGLVQAPPVRNGLDKALQQQLRKRKIHFKRAEQALRQLSRGPLPGPTPEATVPEGREAEGAPGQDNCDIQLAPQEPDTVGPPSGPLRTCGPLTDEDVVRLRPHEKRRLDISGKLYLAPLTTCGNLPFRRICKRFGADVTCGEMAVCTNLLQGQTSEWALLKRHPCEDIFGVQLEGAFPDTMTKCAELLNRTIEVDFVDINVGCPIDLVFKKGGGCALMNRLAKFQQIVRGMNQVLDVPLTVKLRTGVQERVNLAHRLLPDLRDWGAALVTVGLGAQWASGPRGTSLSNYPSLPSPLLVSGSPSISCLRLSVSLSLSLSVRLSRVLWVSFSLSLWSSASPAPPSLPTRPPLLQLHGRSREQRYTKLADWQYIEQCVAAARPMPLFGNGDVLSYEDANRALQTGVAGVMIARGALLKPWLFTEIKEQRHWDISSSERLDILRDFTHYGLEHWGSDTQGVEKTRRFLLEWLSFLCRYVPVGLLERLPQRINERPPYYLGRDYLETLMASQKAADWIRISEMLLGPVPPNFVFLPKHKANAYK